MFPGFRSRARTAPLFALLASFLGSLPVRAEAPKVVATIKPIHSLVAAVMDGVGAPALLLQGASSPHAYSLRPSDARALEGADVIFWVGRGMEGFLDKPLAALAGRARVVTLSRIEGMRLIEGRTGGAWEAHTDDDDDDEDEDGHDESAQRDDHDDGAESDEDADHQDANHGDAAIDMHLWLDTENARRIVAAAVTALGERDAANAERYAANGRATDARIQALTREIAARLAPVRDVPYVVFHDAYHYFEARFKTNAIGSISVHSGRSPGAKRLHEVRKKIMDVGARCVFSEPQFKPALAETLIEGTDARLGVLDPLGAKLAAGGDAYFVLMRTLADALRTCLAPKR